MDRITKHMILPVPKRKTVRFYFDGRPLEAYEGEVISSALFANGIRIFGLHPKDKNPQGIFCANGQCSQCNVIADGVPVKACITSVSEGMKVEGARGLPSIPAFSGLPELGKTEELKTDALIIGGGPAGLAAAIELGKLGASVLLVDDKHKPGGKLVLQTHKFFGSVADCYAGTRGVAIADKLENEVSGLPSVEVWLNSVAVGVYCDGKVGIIRDNRYLLCNPKALLVAAGAREKSMPFAGNTLPGVYGAGAFQTLVNRDLVKAAERVFIAGGGNVGLIAGYHAIQAGIKVAGLCEVLSSVGGYKVHADKLARFGVPIFTSHTVLSANGRATLSPPSPSWCCQKFYEKNRKGDSKGNFPLTLKTDAKRMSCGGGIKGEGPHSDIGDKVESVTIARVDDNFETVKGTEKTFKVDTVLVAVGLNPCDELYLQAKEFGMNAFVAGDAQEIAEASAAMFSGRIAGRRMAESLGLASEKIPAEWHSKLAILKSKPGRIFEIAAVRPQKGVYPVFHCSQEIPCDPCAWVCPKKSIRLRRSDIMALPFFEGDCTGCARCVAICPGLAVTLVDYRKDENFPTVTMAFEAGREILRNGESVKLTDAEGAELATAEVTDAKDLKCNDNTILLSVKADKAIAEKAAGIKLFKWQAPEQPVEAAAAHAPDDVIVCRCERVTMGEIRKVIKSGVRDINQLKALTRGCMGSCGGKTCESQILAVFKSEGVKPEEITGNTLRPLVMEVFLGQFCNTVKSKPALEP